MLEKALLNFFRIPEKTGKNHWIKYKSKTGYHAGWTLIKRRPGKQGASLINIPQIHYI